MPRLLRAAALAVALLALGASACSSPLGSCGLIAVVITPSDTVRVAVGDSTLATATTISSCPQQISPAVTFASGSTAIATVRALGDTSAVVKGVSAGITFVLAQSKDRSNVRSGVPVKVTGP